MLHNCSRHTNCRFAPSLIALNHNRRTSLPNTWSASKVALKNCRLRVHNTLVLPRIEWPKDLHERQNGSKWQETSHLSRTFFAVNPPSQQWRCHQTIVLKDTIQKTALPSCLENMPCELKTMCCSLRLNACPQMSRISRKTLEESQQLFVKSKNVWSSYKANIS